LGLEKDWDHVNATAQIIDTVHYVDVPRGQPFSGRGKILVSVVFPLRGDR